MASWSTSPRDHWSSVIRSLPTDAVRRVVVEALPWATFLPDKDLDQLAQELIAVTQGAASLDNLSPVAVLLAQWRHTAEVYADPVHLGILNNEPEGDFGMAVAPDGAGVESQARRSGRTSPTDGRPPCLRASCSTG
jgi:hypothetical protein